MARKVLTDEQRAERAAAAIELSAPADIDLVSTQCEQHEMADECERCADPREVAPDA
jgi:hypothetical protein